MIPLRVHAIIDYLVGLLLLVAPYLFGFATGEIEQVLPQVLGVLTLVMSLITRYDLSIAKIIPVPIHLGVDAVAGVLLAASPWLFGFADVIWWPHVLVGVVEILVVVLTRRHPSPV
ncbi:SPW repeat domain-containing protein [Pelagibacterium montanilacus]|uniref:SPW repeat domain-containing protein n=1 Tax=Pelagibacterium montanilacus TaxID=2185280 RepID=UPI000F8F684B|nr:hypothetical protein [Pelagibacterium montanilacus]